MVNIITPCYSRLKAKEKKEVREKCYSDIILQSLTSMFNYNFTVDNNTFKRAINSRLELMLRLYGKVAFFEDDGVLKFGECHFINSKNEIDWNGTSDGVTIKTLDGKAYERTLGVDCVLMANNNLYMSETNIFRFVEQLSEVDLSQVDLLINARNHPIIVAKNDKDADVIKKAIENNRDGLPLTVAQTGSIARSTLQGVDDNIQVLTVTDPQTATLFQYYSHYHLDLTGRLYGMYGLSTFNTGKMAQTNDLEVSGSLASSMVIPMNNYKCRVEACEEISKMFNIDFSVEFGDAWKNQLAMLQGIKKDDYNVEMDEIDTNGDGVVDDNDVVKDGNGNDEEVEN